jgi:hypothetical protein
MAASALDEARRDRDQRDDPSEQVLLGFARTIDVLSRSLIRPNGNVLLAASRPEREPRSSFARGRETETRAAVFNAAEYSAATRGESCFARFSDSDAGAT